MLHERRLARFPSRRVRHSYSGFSLEVELGDPVGEAWYDRDWLELPEITLLRQGRLGAGADVFDLGAHQGVVALILARIVEPDGRVLAVEADPHSAALALRNIERNAATNVTLVHAAVASHCGVVAFGLDGSVDVGDARWGSRTVASRTVDSLADDYGTPDVLFIDVEGFEVEVLRGATRTLQSSPDAFVEVHEPDVLKRFSASARDVLAFFPRSRYAVFVSEPNESGVFEPLNVSDDLLSRRFFLIALSRDGLKATG